MSSASPLQDAVLCLWFALAAVAFWSPSFGFVLPAGLLNALYAVFLLVSLTVLALRLLRQDRPPKEDALRRGH